MAAFYCAVCRQTSFSGKGHIFGKSHQSRLRVVLLKFSEKVKEARRTIKKPYVEKCDFTQHQRTFWCYCCGMEVERNVTDGNMTVLFGGLLEHMATAEHRKSTHKFWWENKADPKLRDRFIITQEETERFKAEVEKVLESFVEKEDEHIKQQADHIRAQEKHRLEVLQSFLKEPEKELELPNGSHSLGNSVEEGTSSHLKPTGSDEQAGPSRVDSMVESHWPGPGQGLTFIGYQDSSNSGNVHTGAIPPWLQEDLGDGNPGMAAQQEIGPSLQDFLKQKEQEKLRKLPANRVGANFDHSSKTDANWLPSFGRVWNSGRRWQSRHQFRAEEEGQTKRQKREHGSAEGSKMPKGVLYRLCVTQDMSKDWGEPSERERQMLKIRRDSDTKAAELAKMEKMLQETRSLLDKKPGTESQDYQGNMVEDLEERVRCSRRQRRSSLHHTQMLESQMKTVKDELEGTLDHLQELRDKLRRSQQKAEERKVAMEKLAAGLPR